MCDCRVVGTIGPFLQAVGDTEDNPPFQSVTLLLDVSDGKRDTGVVVPPDMVATVGIPAPEPVRVEFAFMEWVLARWVFSWSRHLNVGFATWLEYAMNIFHQTDDTAAYVFEELGREYLVHGFGLQRETVSEICDDVGISVRSVINTDVCIWVFVSPTPEVDRDTTVHYSSRFTVPY